MIIELYLVPEDMHGKALKLFLTSNNLKFNEIITNDINVLSKIAQSRLVNKTSLLRIKYSSSVHIIPGFQDYALSQLLEHIKKYNPKF